ncbi:MAG: anti-sigma-D factor RsdA [Actinomycetota bacterium]|nr:anti-sigma-D factor RsdA [Actinomycetota bacterium]
MPRRDGFPPAGYPNGDAHRAPADLAAVQADDALLDLLGRAGHTPSDADDELTRVLAAWRREVHAEPVGELVDTNTALAVIRAAQQPVRRRNPVFGSIAAAAAILVIAFSGVGLVAKSAQPGDRLWGVTQVLYSDYARSVEAAVAVRTELEEANTALKEGNPEQAKKKLERVQQQLPVIGEDQGRTDLTAKHRQLEQILAESPDAGSAKPSAAPGSPQSAATSARPEHSAPPESREQPPLTEPATTPNPTTEPGSPTSVAPPTTVTSRRGDPRRGYQGEPPSSGHGRDFPGSRSAPDARPGSDVSDSDNARGTPPGCGRPGPQPPYCAPPSGNR